MKKIKEIRFVANITGENETGKWDVYGTDLGVPVYSPTLERMYFLFGDTFGRGEVDSSEKSNWRGTVAGYTDDFDFTRGINWHGFLADEKGDARQLVAAHYSPNADMVERTKISQGGIEIDGALYVFYESINHWGPYASGLWYLNFNGTLKSTDGGKSFEKVYDLTWVEPTEDPYRLEVAGRLATETMDMQPSGVEFDVKAHIAPGFGQMYGCDGKDGYIYIFGRYGGRIHGIKVGRVKKENFETFSAYEYLTEFKDGEAVWKPYREGLNAIIAEPEKAEVIPAPTSNMSVAYNEYLSKWMLTYYYPGEGINYALSDTPYGPYTTPEVLLPMDHEELMRGIPSKITKNCLYGGFTHEKMMRENGKIVPLIVSQWYSLAPETGNPNLGKKRYYGSRMFEIEFE